MAARILCVYEQGKDSEIYPDSLRSRGYEVKVVHTEREALDALRREGVVALIADTKPLGKRWSEFFSRVTAPTETGGIKGPDFPFIFHSAEAIPGNNPVRWAADGWVVKDSGNYAGLCTALDLIFRMKGITV